MAEIIATLKSKSGRDITFRYPELGDAEMITNYINKASAEKTFLALQGVQFTVEQETQWLEGVVKDMANEKYVYVMACDGDQIIGSADVKMRSDSIKSHTGVFGIIIDSDYRGDGIGEMLTRVVIDEAKKRLKELKIITLDVFSNNEKARNLYKKIGFVEYGLLPNGLSRNGEYSDEVLMYLNV